MDNLGKARWLCVCNCGTEKVVDGYCLRSGQTTSCGCYRKETSRKLWSSVEDRALLVSLNTPYTVVDPFSGRSRDNWIFNCKEHGNFKAIFDNLYNKGRGCPSCTRYGFNKDVPASIYILSISYLGSILCYKVGITNRLVKDRLRSISNKTKYDVCVEQEFYFNKGLEAMEVESYIKSNFATQVLDKDDFKDGYTETFRKGELQKVISYINKYKEKYNVSNT